MKHLKQLLALIRQRWASRVERPINQQPKAGNERNPTDTNTEWTAPVTQTIEDVRDTIIQKYQRSQKEQQSEDRKNRTVTKFAVAGAWIYAAIATFQWCEMRQPRRLPKKAPMLR